VHNNFNDQERYRLNGKQHKLWREWGPYLAYRQWGTVREDYSSDGSCWDNLPHDHARSRAYRWGEDGLFGISDIGCHLCLSPSFWNFTDNILKERLFGLTGPQGNNGEDVKEVYYHLNALPSHSYLRALYRYPMSPYPYERLLRESRKRQRGEPEFELVHTGVFDRNEYFNIEIEYAKAAPRDILLRISVTNKAPYPFPILIMPQLWFRNTWSWGRVGESYPSKPRLFINKQGFLTANHASLVSYNFLVDPSNGETSYYFTENETNYKRLFDLNNPYPFVKDSLHEYVIRGERGAINPLPYGTKVGIATKVMVPSEGRRVLKYRLLQENADLVTSFDQKFNEVFDLRINESQRFYDDIVPENLSDMERKVVEQAYSGLVWSKQFYYYSVKEWREGDPGHPTPPALRKSIRNVGWDHLFNRDILSMPDKWEYPWYAAWDTAFHMIPFVKLDPVFTKHQLLLFLREWYMHPNGQIPAYEFAFSDVNPPVHAWACWRVYKMAAGVGHRDRDFLARAFHKLLVNFTWWVNRKDFHGKNLFSGGFLGLDNIGVFDRSAPLPEGQYLEQADATAWMAFYCTTMLSIALELAVQDPSYSDIASKFFEHFVSISDAINHFRGTGLWNDVDGFYYDQLLASDDVHHIRVRSLVGLIPLFAVSVVDDALIQNLPNFKRRMNWFFSHRPDLLKGVEYKRDGQQELRLLSLPTRERLLRIFARLFDENEFLSPYGIRSLSKAHLSDPYELNIEGTAYRVDYTPGESQTSMFGGNSNWRGPIWFPVNYLLVEALERYHYFYGDEFMVEYPTNSGVKKNLIEISRDISWRLTRLFISEESLPPTYLGPKERSIGASFWKDAFLFNEYFDAETGRGLGACLQTGWTSLVTQCFDNVALARAGKGVNF
jgi:hypothetical protein